MATRTWPGPSRQRGRGATVHPGLIAAWAPVASGGYDVVLLDPATGRQTRLTYFDHQDGKDVSLDWAPDGSGLAISWYDLTAPPFCSDLFIAAGGLLVRPAPSTWSDQTGSYDGPRGGSLWAPSSSRIAIVRYHWDGAPLSGPPREEIWLLPRDGGPIRSLGSPCDGCAIYDLAWSPDGTRLAAAYVGGSGGGGIAFGDVGRGAWVRREGTPGRLVGWTGATKVLLKVPDPVDPSANRLSRIPAGVSGSPEVLPGWVGSTASLSPDGSTVATVLTLGTGARSHDVLAVIDLGSGRRRLVWTSRPGSGIWDVMWAPDGSGVAFNVVDTDPAAPTHLSGLWIASTEVPARARRIRSTDYGPIAWQPVWR